MRDNKIIELKVSKIIPAEKKRVFRMLSKVDDLSSFVPFIKSVEILERHHNAMKTRWKIEVNEVVISWEEESLVDFDRDEISFSAVQGDLSVFKGKWTIRDCSEGTEVTVEVQAGIDIPAISIFAEKFIEKIITRNFEAILQAIEQHLISTRYAQHKQGAPEKIAGFGIIGHLYNYTHLENSLKMLNPEVKLPSREFLGPLFHLTPSFKLFDIKNFTSAGGDSTDGCFIVATFIPDMIEKDVWTIFSKVVHACKIAEKHGVGIVTLGGFTSIVAERIGHQISEEVDVPVTTGNTFTAAMTIEGVYKAAGLLDLDLSRSAVTVVGGTGDIGSACSRVLSGKVRQLTITGRTKRNLNLLRQELSRKKKAKIIATTDNKKAVSGADIVIAAASAPKSILDTEWFKPGSIICDVGYPKNISYAPVTRGDILVFSGGLARSPMPLTFPIDIGLPSADIVYGCFAEAMILSLEKRFEGYSFGRGNIFPKKIEEIRKMGEKHGFTVSDFYWGNELIDEQRLKGLKTSTKNSRKNRKHNLSLRGLFKRS